MSRVARATIRRDGRPARPRAHATFDRDRRRAAGPLPSRSGRARRRPDASPSTRPIRAAAGIPLVGRLAARPSPSSPSPSASCTSAPAGSAPSPSSVGGVVTGFVEGVTATPIPAATPVVASATRRRSSSPSEPYTNQDTVDLVVTVPTERRRRSRLPHPGLPRPRGPGPGADPGGPAGRDAADDHPGRADQGHQRLHGDARRARRRVRAVAARPLRPRPDQAADQAHLAQGRRDGQPQGGRPRGPDAGALDAHRPQRATPATRSAATADSDGTFALRLPLATGSNQIVITATDPAGNVNEHDADGQPRVGQAARLAERRRPIASSSGSLPATDPPDRDRRRPRRQAARGRRRDVHPEHPRDPDGDRRGDDRCERAGVVRDDHPRRGATAAAGSAAVLVRTARVRLDHRRDASITITK